MLGGKLRNSGSASGAAAKSRRVAAKRLDHENHQQHGVGVIHVEHQARDQGEHEPLTQGALLARLVPIKNKQRNRKSGMRVRPGRIEIHVYRKRAGPPNRQRREEGPQISGILARQAKCQEQPEESPERRAQSHGQAIRSGEAVRRLVRAERACQEHTAMCQQQKGRPQHCRADGKVIIEMAGARAKHLFGLAVLIEARFAKGGVRGDVVVLKIQTVIDERRARKSVVAHAVAAHPGIQKRKGEEKKQQQRPLPVAH